MRNLYLFILFIYLIKNVESQCTYTNSIIGQTYDFTPIAKDNGLFYQAAFPAKVWTDAPTNEDPYSTFFNFCNRVVTDCGIDTFGKQLTGCQKYDTTGVINALSIVDNSPTTSYSGNIITLMYTGAPATQCGGSPRLFYQYFECNPDQEVLIKGPKEEPRCTYEVHIETKYACRTCPLNCSGHGTCSPYYGVCSCDSQTNGTSCEGSKLSIDSVIPSSVKGGQIVITGYFGTQLNLSLLSVLIGTEPCISPSSPNQTTILCTAPPYIGYGLFDLNITYGDLHVSVPNYYEYQLLKCPLDCSPPHGTCYGLTGTCDCDSMTTNYGCQDTNIYISSTSVVSTNGGILVLFGYFGYISSQTNVWVGDVICDNVTQTNNKTISCFASPGIGFQNITIRDSGVFYSATNIFYYTPIIISYSCPKNCTGHGSCRTETGECVCEKDYFGPDCASLFVGNKSPESYSRVNTLTSVAYISNVVTTYSLGLHSLVELSFNGSIEKEFLLEDVNTWTTSTVEEDGVKKTVFEYQLLNSSPESYITYKIEEVLKTKEYSFAGINFTKEPNSIKTTITIDKYKYMSSLNNIQLRIKSSIEFNGDGNEEADCNSKETSIEDNIDNTQPYNVIIISKDSKRFYSRILNRYLSDGRDAIMTTSIVSKGVSDSIIIGANLQHCVDKCIIDPDYSVLVSPDYQSSCPNNEKKWILIVSIVIPVVVFAAIIATVSVVYKKYSVPIRIKLHTLKSKTISRK